MNLSPVPSRADLESRAHRARSSASTVSMFELSYRAGYPAPNRGNPRRMTVSPGALDQHVTHTTVAGLGDPAAPDRVASRALAGHEAEIAHETPRQFTRSKLTLEIANLRESASTSLENAHVRA